MATVQEINETFSEKGLGIELPLPLTWLVQSIDVLAKSSYPGGVRVLLGVKYIDDQGKKISDTFLCEGQVTRQEKPKGPQTSKIQEPLKKTFLPLREQLDFVDENDAYGYLQEAINHLFVDKEYTMRNREEDDADLCFYKGEQGFFLNIAVRSDEGGLKKAKHLVALRFRRGALHDYGLVIPAFQEPLGIPLRMQERWVSSNIEYFSNHRIGIYAVHNQDPNRIYAFTVYPKSRELMRYFVTTTPQWSLVRERYVAGRKKGDTRMEQ